jgi:hypothetical protein
MYMIKNPSQRDAWDASIQDVPAYRLGQPVTQQVHQTKTRRELEGREWPNVDVIIDIIFNPESRLEQICVWRAIVRRAETFLRQN